MDQAFITTHYSPAHNPTWLLRHVREMSEAITRWIKADGHNPDTVWLVYSGLSGTVYGTAILLELHRTHNVGVNAAYVRKVEDTQHHGNGIEYGGPGVRQPASAFVFVDDLVSSGATFRRCKKAMIERMKPSVYKEFPLSRDDAEWYRICGYDQEVCKVNEDGQRL